MRAWIVFLLLVATTLVQTGCQRDRAPPARAATLRVPVTVVRVTLAQEPYFQPIAGTVRPLHHATIAARVVGVVTAADIAIGQQVTAGDILVTLQSQELVARSEQAKAMLDQAARDAARESTLFTQGSSTGETARAAADRLRAAQATFDEAKSVLGYTSVIAPFSGVITRKLVNSGDYASPGVPLFELEAPDRLRVELAVPENLHVPPPGGIVRISRGPHQSSARLVEASIALDPVTRTRDVILELPANTPLRSGEFVHAFWPAGDSESVRAPADAVRSIGQIERAFVVIHETAVLRVVTTGARDNDQVQILSGLQPDERVIIAPPPGLRDGQPVAVLP